MMAAEEDGFVFKKKRVRDPVSFWKSANHRD